MPDEKSTKRLPGWMTKPSGPEPKPKRRKITLEGTGDSPKKEITAWSEDEQPDNADSDATTDDPLPAVPAVDVDLLLPFSCWKQLKPCEIRRAIPVRPPSPCEDAAGDEQSLVLLPAPKPAPPPTPSRVSKPQREDEDWFFLKFQANRMARLKRKKMLPLCFLHWKAEREANCEVPDSEGEP